METPCPKFGDNKIYQFPLKELKITPAMTRFHQSFLKVDSYKKKHSTNEMHEYVEMAEGEVFKFSILFILLPTYMLPQNQFRLWPVVTFHSSLTCK